MNPVVATVLFTLVGIAALGGAAWRLVPAPAATPVGRIARWVTVALAGCAGAVLASDLYGATRLVSVAVRLLGNAGFVGNASAFAAQQRAAIWYSTIGSILLDVAALLGLAGLVYVVALRRAGARA